MCIKNGLEMKRLIIGSLFIALLGFGALKLMFSGVEVKAKANLPWMVSTTADGSTHILGVDIGKTTFKELMFKLKLLAEPALFEAPDGTLTLEAYFGKKKFGILEARLIAELDADEALLKQMLEEQAGKDSARSKNWKYALSAKNTPKLMAVMITAGLYDNAGDWFYLTGTPAKSGVGGGILAIVPGKLGIGVVSPPLDKYGNSVRGQKAAAYIINKLGLNPLAQ